MYMHSDVGLLGARLFAEWGFSERLCQKRSSLLKNAIIDDFDP